MNNNLPSGIYAFSGDEALKIHTYKNKLIDLYIQNGFELVLPPLVNFASNDTSFKFADNISGKTLEIVDDITPQISVIDSGASGVRKYCYGQNIIKQTTDDFYSSRMPTQVGAEIYEDITPINTDLKNDFTIIKLMLDSLKSLGIENISLTIGNLSVFNTIITSLGLVVEYEEIKDIFARKSLPDLQEFITKYNVDGELLLNYFECDEPLALSSSFELANKELEKTNDLAKILVESGVKNISFDLQDTKSYYYHDGMTFAAYCPKYSKAIARGGRFSDSNNRSGVGFSFDLDFLVLK